MLILFSTVSSSTVTNLFPTLVSTLGYPPTPSLLLTAPPYILAVLVTFANAWHADRRGERYWHVTLPLYVAIVSFVVSAATGKVGARYAAMMFMVPGVYASYVVGLAWVSNTLPRPAAKVSEPPPPPPFFFFFFFLFFFFFFSPCKYLGEKKVCRRESRSLVSDKVRAFLGWRRRDFVFAVKKNQCDDYLFIYFYFYFIFSFEGEGVKDGCEKGGCPNLLPTPLKHPANKEEKKSIFINLSW